MTQNFLLTGMRRKLRPRHSDLCEGYFMQVTADAGKLQGKRMAASKITHAGTTESCARLLP